MQHYWSKQELNKIGSSDISTEHVIRILSEDPELETEDDVGQSLNDLDYALRGLSRGFFRVRGSDSELRAAARKQVSESRDVIVEQVCRVHGIKPTKGKGTTVAV